MTDLAITVEGSRDRVAVAAPGRRRADLVWLGLLPFFAFLALFLLLPALGVVDKALHPPKSGFTFKAITDVVSNDRDSFVSSVKLSVVSAAIGTVVGTIVAYAVATAKRPKWLRTVVSAFSGVAANMGGVILAFAFFSLIGRQGLATYIMKWAGFDLYGGTFSLASFAGFVIVYSYFQIPLMVLVTLPAVDGLKTSWREASANLGGTTFTYWRRIGLPVLAPSMLGGFLLLFANSFSAFATAYALGSGTGNLVPLKISFDLQGDVSSNSSSAYALATWMIIVMAASMLGYLLLRKRAERWRS